MAWAAEYDLFNKSSSIHKQMVWFAIMHLASGVHFKCTLDGLKYISIAHGLDSG